MAKIVLKNLLVEKHEIDKAQAEMIVNTILEGMKSAIVSQRRISFKGFGTFYVAAKDNKSTSERVFFTASPALQKSVKNRNKR